MYVDKDTQYCKLLCVEKKIKIKTNCNQLDKIFTAST